MALSTFDLLNLSKQDQDKITYATDMWNSASSPEEKASWHNYAESIRQASGYSGDTATNYASGGGYTQTGFKIPQLGEYDSPYEDRINEALSSITDREAFSYDPNNDPLYQTFLDKVNRTAQTTFDNTIAGTSVGTGGRPNSWASTVASQEMGNILMSGADAMPTFRDTAYQMYKDEGTLSLEKLNALMGLDETTYNRFVDSYNAELDRYNSAITSKESRITEALDRTQLTGFVSNSDALILGVPAGTLSAEATQRAWDMEDYLKKAKIDLQYAKSSSSGSGSGSSGGSGNLWSKTDVFNYLKDTFGLENSKINGTAEEIGEVLYSYYQAGYISEAKMKEYAVAFGGKLPTDSGSGTSQMTDDPVVNALIVTIKKALGGVRSQAELDSAYKQVKAMVEGKVSRGEITEEQANKALASLVTQ